MKHGNFKAHSDFKRDLALHVSPTIAVGADANFFLVFGSIVEGAIISILTQSASIKVKKPASARYSTKRGKKQFYCLRAKNNQPFQRRYELYSLCYTSCLCAYTPTNYAYRIRDSWCFSQRVKEKIYCGCMDEDKQ